ncbi:hypothetical protein N9M10_04385 [Hellea sp.]|nr:hypothetical protein [Hellea sp.]
MKRPIKFMAILFSILFAAIAIYSVYFFTTAMLPQVLRPDEVKNAEIITLNNEYYLEMDIYTGHSALNPEGVLLKNKNDRLIVKPVYCLIDAPIKLCRTDVPIEFMNALGADSFSSVRVKLPKTSKKIILRFRYGDDIELIP